MDKLKSVRENSESFSSDDSWDRESESEELEPLTLNAKKPSVFDKLQKLKLLNKKTNSKENVSMMKKASNVK